MNGEIEYVVTTSPGSAQPFQCECRSVPGLTLVQNLEDNKFLCRYAPGTHSIFARHRFSVNLSSPVPNPESLNSVVDILLERINLEALKAQPIRFDVSASWELSWDSHDLIDKLAERGLPRDGVDQSADMVVSVYLHRWCDSHTLFAGASSVRENLSARNGVSAQVGEEPIESHGQILAEVERLYGPFTTEGRALDLGAAPGGWTRFLANKGLEIDAVDPTELDSSVAALEQVRPYLATADDFLRQSRGPYELAVCDMSVGSGETVQALLQLQPYLSSEAQVVAVINLKKSRMILSEARKVIALLGQVYQIYQARQLPFNELAITVLLRPL